MVSAERSPHLNLKPIRGMGSATPKQGWAGGEFLHNPRGWFPGGVSTGCWAGPGLYPKTGEITQIGSIFCSAKILRNPLCFPIQVKMDFVSFFWFLFFQSQMAVHPPHLLGWVDPAIPHMRNLLSQTPPYPWRGGGSSQILFQNSAANPPLEWE